MKQDDSMPWEAENDPQNGPQPERAGIGAEGAVRSSLCLRVAEHFAWHDDERISEDRCFPATLPLAYETLQSRYDRLKAAAQKVHDDPWNNEWRDDLRYLLAALDAEVRNG
jgi:hypothetical protein